MTRGKYHHRAHTSRDSAMSTAMRNIRASHPHMRPQQVLAMAAKQTARVGSGYNKIHRRRIIC